MPFSAAAGEDYPARAAGDVDLEGSWYVLIHYRTHAGGEPELAQWDDCIWRFERRGARLRWSELPTPLFEDESGRFELRQSGRSARALGFWEPSADQLGEIRIGLAVSERGGRSKGLRGSAREGYRSSEAPHAQSASVIDYAELWKIEGLLGLPVFTQDAQLRSARAEGMEGVTRYEVQEIRGGGDELRGRFERDGVQSGRFRMLHTPARRGG